MTDPGDIDDARSTIRGSITYPMRARPDGMAVAIRAGIDDKYPWWITAAGAGGLYADDADVAGWTPLVRQPAARDDADVWVPYTALLSNVGDNPDQVREYLAGPTATVVVNAPLALIQCSITAQIELLRALARAGLLLPQPPAGEAMTGNAAPAAAVWSFIIDWGEADQPRLTDLPGLETVLTSAVANNHYSGDPHYPTVYRYLGEGRTERIEWRCVPGTGEWVANDTDENTPAHQYPQYQVTGPDGTTYLTFMVNLTEC